MVAIPIALVLLGILFAVGNAWIILRSKQRELERRIEDLERKKKTPAGSHPTGA